MKKITLIYIILLFVASLSGCVDNNLKSENEKSKSSPNITISYFNTNPIYSWELKVPGHSPQFRNGTTSMISIRIENNGYESFNVDPNNFKLVVNHVGYNSVENGKSPYSLQSVILFDGGRTEGILLFEIPADLKKPPPEESLYYEGFKGHNIISKDLGIEVIY